MLSGLEKPPQDTISTTQSSDVSITPPHSDVRSPARRQLLGLATALCGATVASALLGSRPAHADLVAKLGKVLYLDPIVLNFAFEMEELESDFFTRISRSAAYASLEERDRNVLNLIAAQDMQHFEQINAVRGKLGYKGGGHLESINAEASRRPKFFRYPKLHTRDDVMKTALDIKENVLFAYHGAVGLVRDSSLLAVAASIAGVEGRHAAVLREIMAMDPVPAPFEGALTAQTAGRKLARYGFVGGANIR